jgi:diamine N-acetyltransferase
MMKLLTLVVTAHEMGSRTELKGLKDCMDSANKQSSIRVRRLKAADTDLEEIAAQLNAADSEISVKDFSAAAFRAFLRDESRVYLLAYRGGEIAGAVHGYSLLHPSGVSYFYIDEVDTIVEHRRHGVATALMHEAFAVARDLGAKELWLGTEHDNPGAIAFYACFKPDETDHGAIYTWKLQAGNRHS